MSTELAKAEAPKSALHALASTLKSDPAELATTLKAGAFKGASDAEFQALLITANEYGLNPMLKEFYAFPAKGGGIVPLIGIDGWIAIMNRQPNLDGFECVVSPDGAEATATIYLKDRSHPVRVTEYLDECRRPTDPWKTMPKRMLRNRATAQCVRMAFGISGVMEADEGEAFAKGEMRNITPVREAIIDPFEKSALAGRTRLDAHADASESSAQSAESGRSGAGVTAKADSAQGDAGVQTIEPKGKQTKKRHVRRGTFIDASAKETTSGKWMCVAVFETNKGTAEVLTFSQSLGQALLDLEKETDCEFTVTVGTKGLVTIEDFKVLEGGAA